MKKYILLMLALLITVNLHATPDSNMTIPTVGDGDTIQASEHNTARNTISSTYNAHSHTDITTLTSLGAVGTISTGVWNGTTIAVANGGTGATTVAGAKTNLSLTIGTDVQAYDAQLSDVAGLTATDNGVIIGNGSNFVVEEGATLKTSLGLTIGTNVQAYDAQLDDLADGTLSGASTVAAATALTGAVPIANGGTGQTTTGLSIGAKVINYQGNGSDNRDIPHGLGRVPIFILIHNIDGNTYPPVFVTTGISATYTRCFTDGTAIVNQIQAFDATNVQVGTDAAVNANGAYYDMFVI